MVFAFKVENFLQFLTKVIHYCLLSYQNSTIPGKCATYTWKFSYRLICNNLVKKHVTIGFMLCINVNFDKAWKYLKSSVMSKLFLHFTHFQNFWALIEKTFQPMLKPTGDRSVKTNCMSLVQAVSRPCSNVYAFILWFLKHLAMLYTYDEKVCCITIINWL